MEDILSVETAIISKLKTVTALKNVSSYSGQLDTILTLPLPAVLVMYDSATIDNVAGRGVHGIVTIRFTVLVVGKTSRGRETISTDVRSSLDAVRNALNGLQINNKNKILVWESEKLDMISKAGEFWYAQSYKLIDSLSEGLK
ncbi:hypothetical protein [Candidatus Magnetobacterium casense]|uniref:Uncharacterized protein n=1 Tax=Candidatus Magnetobacterium casense TaxID=1455061 RepID=A0ABS6S2S4_9BACT|nr:hypothetical protein [Candidatus Magnetobacterium casensis]MBV6342683.1 hypothetical protein [Candidatus Magnetobacterium casensis]